jgi:GTP cyclohydrolase III
MDGDDVGSRIELFLLDGNLDAAVAISNRIAIAMDELRTALQRIPGVEVRLFGGDDLIATFPVNSISLAILNELRESFESGAGVTISAGIGQSIQEALNNLRRAKLSGKNQVAGNL